MPQSPLRLAILECDTPLPGTRAKYGGYAGVFTSLLVSALPTLTPPLSPSALDISSYDVVSSQTYPPLESVDGILITGSKHNSFDNDGWILKLVGFVKEVLEQRRVRIVGVCFGHQILGRAMGVKVDRSDKGWETSVTAVDLTKLGQEIFGKTALALHQMHRDMVYTNPPEAESLAYTEKCPVQGMYVPKRVITVQGHPEFNEGIMRELLATRHSTGIFNDELFNDSMTRVDKSQDGVAVAAAFLKFLMEE